MPAYRAIMAVTFDATSLGEAEAVAAALSTQGNALQSWEVLEIQEASFVDDDDATA